MKKILPILILKFILTEALFVDCESPECHDLAADITKNMNPAAKPCEDFFEFACGRWAENHPIPTEELQWQVFSILRQNTLLKTTSMLYPNDSNSDPQTPEAFRKAQRVFQSCMDVITIDANGVSGILSRLNRIGGWPLLMASNGWNSNSTSLSEILAYYARDLDLNPLIDVFVAVNTENLSTNALYIDAALLIPFALIVETSPRDSQMAQLYEMIIAEVAKVLLSQTDGQTSDLADVEKDIAALVDFEYELAKIIPSIEALHNRARRNKGWTINEFQSWYDSHSKGNSSKIIWIDLLQTLFNGTGINFTATDKVIIADTEYIVNLVKLLDATPMRTIVNYIQWSFIEAIKDAAPEAIRNNLLQLGDRYEMCREKVELKHAVGHQFVQRYFSADTKDIVNGIITNISDATATMLNSTPWLQANEKKKALEKLMALKRHIGYPNWYNESAIDDYYKEFTVRDSFLENIIEGKRFSKNQSLSQLFKPVDKDMPDFNPVEVNAQYDVSRNTISFFAGLLQPPLFSRNYSRIIQYARLGAFVGHEISHLFDSLGSQYDKDGNFKSWWSNATSATFDSKVKCFVDQYNKYKLYEADYKTIYVDGNITKDENIADLQGLKAAYIAYEKAKTVEDEKFRLPGLESYTDKQLFFLIFATNYCGAQRPIYYEIGKRSHSIGRIRILGVLSNMKEFSDAFQCTDTDPMNPRTKCVISN